MRFSFIFFILGSFFSFWALARGQDASCSTTECHEKLKKLTVLHGPVKADGCTVCHRLGASNLQLPKNHPSLLPIPKGKINSLCIVCHDDKEDIGHKSFHKVISEKSCIECHNPHSSQNERLLKQNPMSELCVSCHTTIRGKLHEGHGAILTDKKACLNCHDPHLSEEKKLLKSQVGNLCLQCHKKPIQKKDGEELQSIGSLIETSLSKHKPVAEGKCDSCHEPHGSASQSFLKHGYRPPDFLLCMSCHKQELLSESTTSTATQFRNGNTNLHYMHTRARLKAKGCVACHDVHAASQPSLIHTQMNFGEWKVPIKFTKSNTGGTCLAACHREKKYDRKNPVDNKVGR